MLRDTWNVVSPSSALTAREIIEPYLVQLGLYSVPDPSTLPREINTDG